MKQRGILLEKRKLLAVCSLFIFVIDNITLDETLFTECAYCTAARLSSICTDSRMELSVEKCAVNGLIFLSDYSTFFPNPIPLQCTNNETDYHHIFQFGFTECGTTRLVSWFMGPDIYIRISVISSTISLTKTL